MRVAVATYLMAVTLFGPWACCCTAARLTAALVGDARGRPPGPACCRHGGAGSRPADDPGRPRPAEPPGCPCRHGPSQAGALPTEYEGVRQLHQRHASSPAAPLAGLPAGHALPSSSPLSFQGLLALPALLLGAEARPCRIALRC